MSKNIFIVIGVVASIMALIVVFVDVDEGDVVDYENFMDIENSVLVSKNIQKDIEYVVSPIDEKKVKIPVNSKNRVIKREKYLESKTYDKSRKFELSLINKNKDKSKTAGGYTTLQGEIDGSSFFLKVPNHIIDEGSGVTELRVKNLETGDIKFVQAAFLDDMRDPDVKQKLSINSQNIQNYEQTTVEQIVPLRPGERRN